MFMEEEKKLVNLRKINDETVMLIMGLKTQMADLVNESNASGVRKKVDSRFLDIRWRTALAEPKPDQQLHLARTISVTVTATLTWTSAVSLNPYHSSNTNLISDDNGTTTVIQITIVILTTTATAHNCDGNPAGSTAEVGPPGCLTNTGLG